jgi:phosphoribosylglycinamide formyltransferase-1
VPVEDDDTVETLHERIKVAERTMLVDTVGRMAREGFTISDRKVRFGSDR